jgi:hypothetical protein
MVGKPGPKSVMPSARGNSPSLGWDTAGKSNPAKPIPGPESPGQPPAMRKALAKKRVPGSDATGNPGLVR